MLALPRYVVALVFWIALFFNIERLQFNQSELIHIALPVYGLATGLLLLGVSLPQWRTVPSPLLFGFGLISYILVKLWVGLPAWGGAATFVTLFELTAVLVTLALASRVGQLTAEFVETLRGLFVSDLDDRVHPPERAESVLRREMQSARRQNHPVTLLLVEADTNGARMDLTQTAQEVQRVLTRRLGLVALTRLFAQNLRASDTIVREFGKDRWILMTRTPLKGKASGLLERLSEETRKTHGIKLKCGVACFPEQGITFDDLIIRAEQDLLAQQADRRTNTVIESAPIPVSADKTGVNYSSNGSGKDYNRIP